MDTPGAAISGYIHNVWCSVQKKKRMLLNYILYRKTNQVITLRTYGDTELGPLPENSATLVATSGPVSAIEGLTVMVGLL